MTFKVIKRKHPFVLCCLLWASKHNSYSCISSDQFSSVHSLSCVWLFATPWTAAQQASLSIINSPSVLKLMSIELVMLSNYLLHPLLSPSPPAFNLPQHRVFSNESVLSIRWSKYWNFSFSISPSNEYSGLISFRMDWLDLLVVQGTFKNLFQHHSSKASILQCSAFFIVQLSYPYMYFIDSNIPKSIILSVEPFDSLRYLVNMIYMDKL